MATTRKYPVALKVHQVKPGTRPLSKKNHALVRAAASSGLTGIKIIRYPKSSIWHGWVLESDQISHLHLGFEMMEAEVRIHQISV